MEIWRKGSGMSYEEYQLALLAISLESDDGYYQTLR